jgi:hypothetical protein
LYIKSGGLKFSHSQAKPFLIISYNESEIDMSLIIGAIMISNKVLLNNEIPTWMYRTTPIEEMDSGWRVFSGNEDEVYLENPSNFKTISADQLILIDETIKVNLLAPINSSFEIDAETGKWVIVNIGHF